MNNMIYRMNQGPENPHYNPPENRNQRDFMIAEFNESLKVRNVDIDDVKKGVANAHDKQQFSLTTNTKWMEELGEEPTEQDKVKSIYENQKKIEDISFVID